MNGQKKKNGGIERLSFYSIAAESRNWNGIGAVENLVCNMSAEYPQSDCQNIDDCTVAQCVQGKCVYTALACNHPNWATCYPKVTAKPCRSIYPAIYKGPAGDCRLSSNTLGHLLADSAVFGFYGAVGQETLWYEAGCKAQAIDCRVGKWSNWSFCDDCKSLQSRDREIKISPSTLPPVGKICPPLVETRNCSIYISDKGECLPPTRKPTVAPTSEPTTASPTKAPTPPTKSPTGAPTKYIPHILTTIEIKFVSFEKFWVDLYNPSDNTLDISGWDIKSSCSFALGSPAVTLASGSIISGKSTLRQQGIKPSNEGSLCLLEKVKGEYTGGYLEFNAHDKSHELTIDK